MGKYQRVLYLPPGGRPHWIAREKTPGGLEYHSWGWRHFGRDPVPPSFHTGWSYQAILSGRAIALMGGKVVPVSAGTFVIVGPGCAYGWKGTAKVGRCKILAWLWRDPPVIEGIRPDADRHRLMTLSPETLRQLEDLHHETLREIKFPDPASGPALDSIKGRIDVLLARARRKLRVASQPKTKFHYALAWLEKHPAELSPAAALSDYLQISPATLNRLFRHHLGQNVRQAAYAIRMKIARKRLATRARTIKEIAAQLGYSHPNDFTRAYQRFWKTKPSAGRKKPFPISSEKLAPASGSEPESGSNQESEWPER